MSAAEQLGLFDDARARRVLARQAGLPAGIVRAFDLMALAEEELAAAGNPVGAFALLMPGILAEYTDELYRSHCRELIARAKAGEDTSLGTLAEALVAMMVTAGASPLRPEALALTDHLFDRLFPGAREQMFPGVPPHRERWDGQVAEDLSALRRKLAQPWRAR